MPVDAPLGTAALNRPGMEEKGLVGQEREVGVHVQGLKVEVASRGAGKGRGSLV